MEYLPTHQQPHIDSKAYQGLTDALWDYLNSDIDTKSEKMQLLSHAKSIFEHYCLTADKADWYHDTDPAEDTQERPWYPTL